MTIDLDTARELIAAARGHARETNRKPVTIVVLDAGAHLIAAEREDGCSIKRFEIANGKAHGALALGMGSRAIMQRAEQQPYFVAAATAAVGGLLIPVPGGVLVRDADGMLVGAVGVSGDTSDVDEEIAVAGVDAIALAPDPG